MKSLIDRLVREWAWRVNNGMPDPKNRNHLAVLADVFRSMKYSEQFISEYISQLSEVDDEKIIKYKDEDGKDAEMKAGSAKTMPMDHPAKKAWDVEKEKEGSDSQPEQDPQALTAKDFERTTDKKDDVTKDKETGKEKTEKKNKFLGEVVDLIIKEDETAGMGAGRFNMSREDLGKYKKYLDGDRPELPDYDIADEDIDTVIDAIKEKNPKMWNSIRERLRKKGDPPPQFRTGEAGTNRIREVLKFYLKTGGKSSITGEVVPFNETQLDHVVSLDNGGKDEPANWEFMESRFNQFKGALTNDVIMSNIEKRLAQSPEAERKKVLQTELKQYRKKAYIDYWDRKFKSDGDVSLSVSEIEGMTRDEIDFLAKGWNKSNPEGTDGFVSRYAASADRASGRKGGGKPIAREELNIKLIEALKLKGVNVLDSDDAREIDEDFKSILDEVEKRKGEIKSIKLKAK